MAKGGDFGWVSPQGEFFPCDYRLAYHHREVALDIIKQRYQSDFVHYPDKTLSAPLNFLLFYGWVILDTRRFHSLYGNLTREQKAKMQTLNGGWKEKFNV